MRGSSITPLQCTAPSTPTLPWAVGISSVRRSGDVFFLLRCHFLLKPEYFLAKTQEELKQRDVSASAGDETTPYAHRVLWKPEGAIQAGAAMGHYCQAARIAVAQIDGGTTLPFTESVRLSSDHGTQGQSGDDDELLQYIRLQVRRGKRSCLLRLFHYKTCSGTFAKTGSGQARNRKS